MLSYEDFLPLTWRPLAEDEFPFQATAWHASNAETLRALLSLEHGSTEKTDDDPRLVLELQRLESKIDLLLGLVAQSLLKDQPLPLPVKTRLTSQDIEWEEREALVVGENILLSIVLNPRYPCAVSLPGSVTEVSTLPDRCRAKAEFLALPKVVQDSLERLVFLHHRKQVARYHKR